MEGMTPQQVEDWRAQFAQTPMREILTEDLEQAIRGVHKQLEECGPHELFRLQAEVKALRKLKAQVNLKSRVDLNPKR